MPVHVRPAQSADADSLAALSASTFALACPPGTPATDVDSYVRSELSAERFRAQLAQPDTLLFTAEVNGAVAGYLMLSGAPAPAVVTAQRPLEILRLYVLKRFHGTGIGLRLMGEAVHHGRSEGHDALWLSVSKENARALAFYRKTGFATVGEQAFAVGSGLHQDYIMARLAL